MHYSNRNRFFVKAMLRIGLILSCVFCCSLAKTHCRAPYECMKLEACASRHGGALKGVLFMCGRSKKCCPPAAVTRTGVTTKKWTTQMITTDKVTTTGKTTTEKATTKVKNVTEKLVDFEKFLPIGKCGQRPEFDHILEMEMANKIFKGKRAEIGEIPWIVHITSFDSKNSQNFCGGTLISKNYVLTAAHCFPDDVERILIKLGSVDLNATRKCDGPLCMPLIREGKHIIHDEYGFTKRLNDIALVKLNESVKFNDFIQPACLPVNTINYLGLDKKNTLLTAGWGAKSDGNRQSRMLRETSQSYFSLKDCQAIYEKYLPFEKIADSHICALGENKSRGLQGDSGGPLLSSQKIHNQSSFVVIGVLSRGPNNFKNINAAPVLYTKVDHYLNWIIKNIQN